MDRIAAPSIDETDETQAAAATKTYRRDWGQHPLNLRLSLPLPFSRWYITLVAGRERRSKDRLARDRQEHPLETLPNLLFLLSIGIVSTSIILAVAVFVLVHGFGWSIELTIPA